MNALRRRLPALGLLACLLSAAPSASAASPAPPSIAAVAAPGSRPAPVAPLLPTVANKTTVLRDVDRALGATKPPSVEVIFVTPGRGGKSVLSEGNPMGHAAIRYTLPSGEERVMNIYGKSGKEMVNFSSPSDYLFDPGGKASAEQRSSLNRTMVSVRLEKVAPEQVVALDRYFQDLKVRAERGDAVFDKGSPVLRNLVDKVVPGRQPEAGNCSLWLTNGLVKAGLMEKPTQWPKKALVNFMNQAKARDAGNVHLVTYQQVPEGNHGNQTHGFVTPFAWRKTLQYWNIDRRADAVVHLDPTTRREIVVPMSQPAMPLRSAR